MYLVKTHVTVYPEGNPTVIRVMFNNNDDVTNCLRHLSLVDVIVHERFLESAFGGRRAMRSKDDQQNIWPRPGLQCKKQQKGQM
jgi:hypothetical protein